MVAEIAHLRVVEQLVPTAFRDSRPSLPTGDNGQSTCMERRRAFKRMQKALTQMNVQLANVISDVSGLTGQAIIRSIIAGEHDRESWLNSVIRGFMPVVRWPKAWRGHGRPGTAVCIAAGSSDVRHLPTTDRRVRSAIAESTWRVLRILFRSYRPKGTQKKEVKTS